MSRCEEIRARISLYLDDELEASECALIEAHLNNCDTCRASLRSERGFLEIVRSLNPLHVASQQLRARIGELLNDSTPQPVASLALKQHIQQTLKRFNSSSFQLPNALQAVILGAILVLALLIALWRVNDYRNEMRVQLSSDFARMAADTHQRHSLGLLPLEIVSDVPQQISAWFAGKVPFLLKLPNYQESSGQEKLYRLEGARLVAYKSDYAAYVAYQMRTRPISLVVTSDSVAQPADGEQIIASGITFHYNSIKGLKVITWSDRGLTYALVSDLEERGQQSCVVCHQGTKDRSFIETLKPK